MPTRRAFWITTYLLLAFFSAQAPASEFGSFTGQGEMELLPPLAQVRRNSTPLPER